MKQKSLTLLLIITILALSMIGCEKKVKFDTGDTELDSALEELWQYEIEDYNSNNQSSEVSESNKKELEILESFVITKKETSTLNGEVIDEPDSYYLVLKVENNDLLDDYKYYNIIVTAEKDGSSKEFDKNHFRYVTTLAEDLNIISRLDKNERYIAFNIDWNEYSYYSLNINNTIKNTSTDYKISNMQNISYEDMVTKCYDDIFNSVTNKTVIINEVEISCSEAAIIDGKLKSKIQFENKGSIPTDDQKLYKIRFLTEDNKDYNFLRGINIPQILPNEKYEYVIDIKNDSISKSFILQIYSDIDNLEDISYLKTN